jgi:hypothetical protein
LPARFRFSALHLGDDVSEYGNRVNSSSANTPDKPGSLCEWICSPQVCHSNCCNTTRITDSSRPGRSAVGPVNGLIRAHRRSLTHGRAGRIRRASARNVGESKCPMRSRRTVARKLLPSGARVNRSPGLLGVSKPTSIPNVLTMRTAAVRASTDRICTLPSLARREVYRL